MFGLCALSRTFILTAGLVLGGVGSAWAQSAQKGTIVSEEAQVYRDADFDSPVIGVVKAGETYAISMKTRGPFYKIRLRPGVLGWIADNDINPSITGKSESASEQPKKSKSKPLEEPPQEDEDLKTAFFAKRYWGPAIEYMNYTEDTMGSERSALMPFVGVKWVGFNTVFSGEIYTDASVLVGFGAPSYYSDATGQSASGYIVNGQFLLQTVTPLAKDVIWFYGFGPMLRYSHFDLNLKSGTTVSGYSADDMAIGAAFNVGLAWRLFKKISVRSDVKYYWEKNRYPALGINVGFPF